MSTTPRIAMVIVVVLLGGTLVRYAGEQPGTAAAVSASSAASSSARSKEQAMTDLMALPELKEWSSFIEKESDGKAHGAVLEYDPKPSLINGKSYYQLSFVQSAPEAVHRLEDFLVGVDSGDIFVDDAASGKPMTLDQWRKEKHPLDLTKTK
ncbi:MAG: hypothetical protein V4463_09945 [Pseudomonadota bacterium]